MKVELTIRVPEDFQAEDWLDADLQDDGMLEDLVAMPVRRSLKEYLVTNYGLPSTKGVDVLVESH